MKDITAVESKFLPYSPLSCKTTLLALVDQSSGKSLFLQMAVKRIGPGRLRVARGQNPDICRLRSSPAHLLHGLPLPSSMLLFMQQGPEDPHPEKVDRCGLRVPSTLRPRNSAQCSFMPRCVLSFLARPPRVWFSSVFLHYFFST